MLGSQHELVCNCGRNDILDALLCARTERFDFASKLAKLEAERDGWKKLACEMQDAFASLDGDGTHKGSCRINYAEQVCTCGALDGDGTQFATPPARSMASKLAAARKAEAALPKTYYPHLPLEDRVIRMVYGWQQAIESNAKLRTALANAVKDERRLPLRWLAMLASLGGEET
jgi:hypothetical protein